MKLSKTAVAVTVMIGLVGTRGLAAGPTTRPQGPMTFELEGDSSAWDAAARERIVKAMTEAVACYNRYGIFKQNVPVTHSPQTPTADANFNGHIRFGGQIGTRTALHEIGHILGVGTAPEWDRLVKNGVWTGEHATAQLRAFDGPDAVLHADRMHFWPYGLNFDREGKTPEVFRKHVLMVAALRADLGLGPAPTVASTRPGGE